MKDKSITYLSDAVIITCVVAAGKSDHILKLAREVGAVGGLVYQARGTGVRERLGLLGIAVETEKDVINILTSSEQSELIMETIYQAGGLSAPGSGFLYTTKVEKVATYLPESMLNRMDDIDNKPHG
ncbi:MAG: P-II family nitrogen regulator [Thiohalomonadales bacterium]